MSDKKTKYTEGLRLFFQKTNETSPKIREDALFSLHAIELVNRKKYEKYIHLDLTEIAYKSAKDLFSREEKDRELLLARAMIAHGPFMKIDAIANDLIHVCWCESNTPASFHSITALRSAYERGMTTLTPEQLHKTTCIATQAKYTDKISETASEILLSLYKDQSTTEDVRQKIIEDLNAQAIKKDAKLSTRARGILGKIDIQKALNAQTSRYEQRLEELKNLQDDPLLPNIIALQQSVVFKLRFAR